MFQLSTILEPITTEKFFDNYWLKKALYIKSSMKTKFSNLFSWEQFNYLINFSELDESTIELIVEGRSFAAYGISTQDVLKEGRLQNFIQQGATLKIKKIHKKIPKIANFIALLRHDLGYEIDVNTYASFPERQAYDNHYDTNDVIILQIEGKKKWKIFQESVKNPSKKQRSSFYKPPSDPPYLECTLQQGDVLYIPRGHWHYAMTVEEPSLHLTLGIHCPIKIDFITWLTQNLHQYSDWRSSLFPYTLDNSQILKEELKQIKNEIINCLNNENIEDLYIQYLQSLEYSQEAYSLPYQAGFNIFKRGIDTIFKRPMFQRVNIEKIQHKCVIHIWNKEITIEHIPASLIEHIFSQEYFTGKDLITSFPDIDWENEIMPVLETLVLEGIIAVYSQVT